jgi:hypothetical protein
MEVRFLQQEDSKNRKYFSLPIYLRNTRMAIFSLEVARISPLQEFLWCGLVLLAGCAANKTSPHHKKR